jgi:hypothetical protein
VALTYPLVEEASHFVQDGNKDQFGETSFMFLLEPALGLERRVTDCLHLNVGLSYRLAGGVKQQGMGNGDFSGASVALAAKIGRF